MCEAFVLLGLCTGRLLLDTMGEGVPWVSCWCFWYLCPSSYMGGKTMGQICIITMIWNQTFLCLLHHSLGMQVLLMVSLFITKKSCHNVVSHKLLDFLEDLQWEVTSGVNDCDTSLEERRDAVSRSAWAPTCLLVEDSSPPMCLRMQLVLEENIPLSVSRRTSRREIFVLPFDVCEMTCVTKMLYITYLWCYLSPSTVGLFYWLCLANWH